MTRLSDSGAAGVQAPAARVRLAEVLATLSLATDLGMGQPMGHALRTCLLAVGLGEQLGLGADQLAEVYYLALLRRIGCTGDAHELAGLFGDDVAAHARSFELDFARPLEVLVDLLRYAGRGETAWGRARVIGAALRTGPRAVGGFFRASCEVAQGLAAQLGLGAAIGSALGQVFERWDGRGFPSGLRGEAIALAVRVVQVAEDAEVYHRVGGPAGAVAAIRRRAAASHDPAIAATFAAAAGELFGRLESGPLWEAVLAAEPGERPVVSGERLDAALTVMAEFADLKSPYLSGHSVGVAELAAGAARRAGLPEADVLALRRAGLVHDLGRVGVPTGIWEKPGPLLEGEWERVRLHPYYTERVLARSAALAPLGALASLHHERLDGSGYHRGVGAGALSPSARILAAADVYQALIEPRGHRPALARPAAAAELRRAVGAGHLDGAVVEAVLAAAGQGIRRRGWPAGLSAREVEVLRLLARGLSNRQMARALVVSEPTVAHHVQHIYRKIGVSTRAAATLFAMQRGLLEPGDPVEK